MDLKTALLPVEVFRRVTNSSFLENYNRDKDSKIPRLTVVVT